MSHPTNKKDRLEISKRKGKNRGDNYFRNCTDLTDEFMERIYSIRRNCTKGCSCVMCGNPRKYFDEKTIQERKFEEDLNNIE